MENSPDFVKIDVNDFISITNDDDKILNNRIEEKFIVNDENEKVELNENTKSENFKMQITEEAIEIWEKILYNKNPSTTYQNENIHSDKYELIDDDSKILNESFNMKNQKVIKNDCDRTRVRDKELVNSFREYLECFLTFYCKKVEIKYKQGMNEIMAPFILLKSKLSIGLSRLFNLTMLFIKKFLTNYYHEDEFYSLQSSLAMLSILLKYHNTCLYNIFEFALISPEMYATSWVLTLFANKTKLDHLYYFWDKLIREDDEIFMHYFIISFLEYHLEEIVSADYSQIPSIISQLTLKSREMIDKVFEKAKKIRSVTPYSFRLFFSQLDIFKPFSRRHKELFERYQPENLLCLPILPSEIFFIAYNKIVSCPDKNCRYFNNLYDVENHINFCASEKNEGVMQSDACNVNNEECFMYNEANNGDKNGNSFFYEGKKNSANEFVIVNKYDANDSDGFAEKTSDSNLQNKLSQLNTFNSQENLDNNPNEGSLSKQHEVSIEFQLNKEEKDAAIMQRKCSSMSQNSSNKPDNLKTNENINKEVILSSENTKLNINEEKDICFFCRRKKEGLELTKARNVEEKLSNNSSKNLNNDSFNTEENLNNKCSNDSKQNNSINNNHYSNNNLNYILLDLRVSMEGSNEKHYDVKPGFLPMTVILDQNDFKDPYFAENLTDRFINEKDKYHFILITSETEYFNEYEEKIYCENVSERDRRKMIYGIQTKVTKEINLKNLKKLISKKNPDKVNMKLKEYDNLKKLVHNFLKKNYKYISFVFGGFLDIHDESLKFNIPLLNHDENCRICKKKNKKKKKYGFISKLFGKSKKDNNSNKNGNGVLNTESSLVSNSSLNNNLKNNDNGDESLECRNSIKSESIRNSKLKDISSSSIDYLRSGSNTYENLNENSNINKENSITEDPYNQNIQRNTTKENLFGVEEISEMISDPNYDVFTSLFIKKENSTDLSDKIQIMIFLNEAEIKIFELARINKNQSNENKADDEELTFILIEKFKVEDIVSIISKKQSKNIITIKFNKDLSSCCSLLIDLITDIDSQSFISKTKYYIEKHQNKYF